MQNLHLSIFINAPKENVWNTMLEDSTYREWTKAFNPGSYYKGSWEEGSKILFLGPGQEGEGEGGLVSRVQENRPYEYLSLEHLGVVKNGVEDTESEDVQAWIGAQENYTFQEKDGGTELSVDSDVTEAEKATMEGMWQKGFARLKELCEA